MNLRKFLGQVLQIAKAEFPELYKKHIEGRRDQFICEHAPPKSERTGKKIGHVSKDLQLLRALGLMFRDSFHDSLANAELNIDKKLPDVVACATTSALARGVIHKSCELAFWEFLSARFAGEAGIQGTFTYFIDSDWSISVAKCEGDQDAVDGKYEWILSLIHIQTVLKNEMDRFSG